MRAEFPWHWIDAAADIDECWAEAVDDVARRLAGGGEVDQVLDRLPSWWRVRGDTRGPLGIRSAIQRWLQALPSEEKPILNEWLLREGIVPSPPEEPATTCQVCHDSDPRTWLDGPLKDFLTGACRPHVLSAA